MKLNLDMASEEPTCCLSSMKDNTYYPSFHYSGDQELALPDEGTMTIRFKRTGMSTNTDRDGEEHYSCSVDVVEIISVGASKGAKKSAGKETEDALDALAKEYGGGEDE